MHSEEGHWKTDDGLALYHQAWIPEEILVG